MVWCGRESCCLQAAASFTSNSKFSYLQLQIYRPTEAGADRCHVMRRHELLKKRRFADICRADDDNFLNFATR